MQQAPVLWEGIIQAGATWSHVLKRGTAIRITDLQGGANVGAIFYNCECPVEGYNMPDTLKAQDSARLTNGFVLYSDMGRILLSITGDSVGWMIQLGARRAGNWSKRNTDAPRTRNSATTITRMATTVF